MASAGSDHNEISHGESLEQDGSSRRVSLVPLSTGGAAGQGNETGRAGHNARSHSKEDTDDIYRKYSLSSYRHPYDITPPNYAHTGPSEPASFHSFSFHNNSASAPVDDSVGPESPWPRSGSKHKRQGMLASMMNFYSMAKSGRRQGNNTMQPTFSGSDYEDRPRLRRDDSEYSQCSIGSDMLEPDDPRMTGKTSSQIHHQGDLEKNTLRQMDYKARRKHIQRIRIEFNVSCT